MNKPDDNFTDNNENQLNEVKIIIENFLEKLTVEFDTIEILDEDSFPILHIKTSDSGVLIGNGGESLKALNHVIKRLVEKKLSENTARFLLDINSYHEKRVANLKNEARILAERARMFKSSIEMNPMNAYERMLIHSTFTTDTDIETESKGEGKMRRVVLKYKEKSKSN